MADAVTIAKGIIEIGASGVADAQAEIQDLEGRLQSLDAQYKAGNLTVSAYAARTEELKEQIAGLKKGIDVADAAIKKFGGDSQKALAHLDSITTKSSAASRGAAQAMQEFGRGVEDFATGGFLGGLNNIPRMIEGIGQAAGLAGPKLMAMASGVSLVATGVYVLYQSGAFGKIAEQLGLFRDEAERAYGEIDQLKLKIKELEEKPVKLAVDYFELEQAKKRLEELEAAAAAFKGMGGSANPFEQESGKSIADAFKALNYGEFDEVRAALKANMVKQISSTSEPIQAVEREEARAAEAQRKAEARLASSTSQASQEQALRDIGAAKDELKAARDASSKARIAIAAEKGPAEIAVGKIWDEAIKGSAEAQKKLADQLRAIGREDLARGIEAASPAEQERQNEIDTKLDRSIDQQQAGHKEQEKQRKLDEADDEHEMQASKMLRDRRKAEDSRLANAMMGSVGQKLLKNPEMTDDELMEEVKTAMAKAGVKFEDVAEAAEGVTKNIRDKINADITQRALGRDDQSQEKARADLIKEAQAKDDKSLPKAEVMGTESYLNKVLIAGLSKKDPTDVAKEQLDVAKKSDTTLDKILKEVSKPQKAIPATFGPGR